ncbi:hypothetical protein HMPREF0511_0726 [Limosilactobacillus fermentum ATCC 14931]|nr:hypothetical protein HMPREF0511_0726 [Limosilactobacillus fermentum ATCC 14931]
MPKNMLHIIVQHGIAHIICSLVAGMVNILPFFDDIVRISPLIINVNI